MNIEEMTVRELRELAERLGIKVPGGMKKPELITLIEAEKTGEGEEEDPETGGDGEGQKAGEGEEEDPETGGDGESQKAGEGEEEDPETVEGQQPEKSVYRAYVGPSIPGGILNHGKILYGTEASIRAYIAPVLERYPKAEGLMVPMENMAQSMKDVKNQKKLLYHRAQELTSEIKRNGGKGNA